jgi:hypothetical protein
MMLIIEAARKLGRPLTLTVTDYPEQAVKVYRLELTTDDGALTWSSAPTTGDAEGQVASMARLMGVEVFAC